MGTYIKGMKTPKCCNDCWALNDDGDYPRCRITQEQRGYNFNIREQKMAKCPLINVPEPHGRLIDADTLMQYFNVYKYEEWTSAEVSELINNALTIIESEVEE